VPEYRSITTTYFQAEEMRLHAYKGVEWGGSAGQPLHCHILEHPKGAVEIQADRLMNFPPIYTCVLGG